MATIISIRAKTEGLTTAEGTVALLAQIADQTSLRYEHIQAIVEGCMIAYLISSSLPGALGALQVCGAASDAGVDLGQEPRQGRYRARGRRAEPDALLRRQDVGKNPRAERDQVHFLERHAIECTPAARAARCRNKEWIKARFTVECLRLGRRIPTRVWPRRAKVVYKAHYTAPQGEPTRHKASPHSHTARLGATRRARLHRLPATRRRRGGVRRPLRRNQRGQAWQSQPARVGVHNVHPVVVVLVPALRGRAGRRAAALLGLPLSAPV